MWCHWKLWIFTSDGARTRNPRLRRPVPYPLGHGGNRIFLVLHLNYSTTCVFWPSMTFIQQVDEMFWVTLYGHRYEGISSHSMERLLWQKSVALPGNRTRVARMGILHDTTTPATPSSIPKQQLTTAQSLYVHTKKPQINLGQSILWCWVSLCGFSVLAGNLSCTLNQSGWPRGLRRCVQVAVHFCGRGFESHFWHQTFLFCVVCIVCV